MKKFSGQYAKNETRSTNQKLIEFFHDNPGMAVSGEDLGRALNISRTAVWKHVRSLKEMGYCIEAVPSRGYRLLGTPDLLIAEEISAGLETRRIGTNIVCFEKTDSTNLEATKLGEQGAVEGTVVIADEQSRGKGRLGRHWESPGGVNLYCSIILRPPIMPSMAPQFTLLSSVAVAQAIESTSPLIPRIKWPNDILVNGMKVSGMLNEMSAEMEKVNFIVLGIGVNLNMRQEHFPDSLRHPASSLFLESGKIINRVEFTRTLLTAFDILYDNYLYAGIAPIREQWLARSAFTRKRVRVSFQGNDSSGLAVGIDDDGALLLEHEGGRIEKVLAGDVSILE